MTSPLEPDLNLYSILSTTAHRPWPLPVRPWRLRQRWRDLLFAHWAVSAADIQRLLPAGLEIDTFDGSAWVGVIPFWMDQVRTRSFRERTFGVPGTLTFPELNLRTYVRSHLSGHPGVFFFSLDCASPLAVLGARTLFHLPYFPAAMTRVSLGDGVAYTSRRLLTRQAVRFDARYRPTSASLALSQSQPGTLTHFLTERYCLFTSSRGRMLVGDIHHRPWTLQPAEAEIPLNEIPIAHGIRLPQTAPILHFSRRLEVILWSLRADSAYG